MSAVPTTPSGRTTPRYSGIPTPGGARSVSGIPTPGRSASRSTASTPLPTTGGSRAGGGDDSDAMRALSDAIRANNPALHRGASATPDLLVPSDASASGRRSAVSSRSTTGGGGGYSSRASTSSSATSSVSGLNGSTALRPRTPSANTTSSSSYRSAATPRTSITSTASRPASRQSDVFRASSRQGYTVPPVPIPKALDLGDPVRIESLGVDGTIQFLGEAEFKEGLWAGVELSPAYAGRGKNDGSVAGVRYFSCAPNCGVFVAPTKLTPLNVRSDSVASGRFTPVSGRETPSLKPQRGPRQSTAYKTPSTAPFKTPEPPKFAPGSRASKYVGLTARDLAKSRDAPPPPIPLSLGARSGSASPTRGSRSPTRAATFATPKPISRPGGSSTSGLAGPTPRRSLGGPGALSLATPRATMPARTPVPDLPTNHLAFLNGNGNRSPSRSSRSATSTGGYDDPPLSATSENALSSEGKSLEANARAIQDKIARLMSSGASSLMDESEITTSPISSPEQHRTHHGLLPAANVADGRTERMQMRIAELEMQLEMEKERSSRASASTAQQQLSSSSLLSSSLLDTSDLSTPILPSTTPTLDNDTSGDLVSENARLQSRIASLETELSTRVDAARDESDSLSAQLRDSADALSTLRSELDASDARTTALREKADASAKRVVELEESVRGLEESVKEEKEERERVAKEREELKGKREELEASVKGLEGRLEEVTTRLEADKRELAMEVDELRLAGQETIALYEERLNNAEANRYDLEDALKALQDQLRKQAEPISSAELTARATTAAQIDNESLQEQVAHLTSRIGVLEDQLHDARAAAEAHEQAYTARMARFRENEAALKKEIDEQGKDRAGLAKAQADALARVQEVTVALQESDAALEDARAEIELLRSDMAVLEAAKGPDDLEPSPTPASQLQAQLEEERQRRAAVAAANDQLKQELTTLKSESEELATKFNAVQSSSQEQLERISEMSRLLDQRTRELENHRSSALSSSSRESTPKSAGINGRSETSNLREQITGLKHVIQELTKENAMLSSSNKVLEKDNQQLAAECVQLRESLEKLEEEFEAKILQEHGSPDADAQGSPLLQDVATLRQAMKDSQKRHEHEMDQMRKKLSDAEMEHSKAINKLNHDLTDLEQLLEARIYKEDELEEEIRQLKSDLRKANKGSTRKNRPSTTSTNSDTFTDTDVVICEACGKPGHDIATCDEVFNGAPKKAITNGRTSISSVSSSHEESQALWCDDCESHGHITSECPYSQDVF